MIPEWRSWLSLWTARRCCPPAQRAAGSSSRSAECIVTITTSYCLLLLQLQMKVREDFTITEKAPSPWLWNLSEPLFESLLHTSSFILCRRSRRSLLSLSSAPRVWMLPSPVTSSQARWASFSLTALLRASCLGTDTIIIRAWSKGSQKYQKFS